MDPSGQGGNEQSYNSVSNIFSKNKSNPIFADSEGHKMYNLCLKIGSGIGSFSSDVFLRRTSTESEPSSLLICLDAAKFVWLCLYSYRDDLSKNLFKITAEECKNSTSG